MALIKCRDCGSRLSTEAESCPTCGASNPQDVKYWWLSWVAGLLLGLIYLYLRSKGG